MKGWTQTVGRLREPFDAMGRSRRVAAAVLALAAVAACAWLLSARSPSVSALDVPASELSASADVLRRAGITADIRDGQLVVPADQLVRARATLRDASANVTASFEKLATTTDIWSTQEQHDKRWQAAKMVALSRLIEEFDTVRSASVLLEAGKGKSSLGKSSGVGASASVYVATTDQRPLSAELVQAIGELVCGSVAGMEAGDVHIVDGAGQSYRALGREAAVQQEQFQKDRLMREQWARRIRAALPAEAVTFVSVALSEEPSPRPTAVRLIVPHDRAAAESLASLRRWAAEAAGLDERAVSCEVDTAAVMASSPAESPAESALASWPHMIWAGPLAGFALGWIVTMLWRGRASRDAGVSPASDDEDDLASSVVKTHGAHNAGETPASRGTPLAETPAARATSPRPLAVLGHLDEAELVALLADEHPRTVAIVLAHVSPEKGAAVLANLSAEQQAQVARLVANFERPGDDILRQIEQGLTRRLAGLAEMVRGRMFDVAELAGAEAGALSSALAGMETRTVALALCAAPESVSQRVLAGLESSRVRAVRSAMGTLGPMRLADVEAAQETLVDAVRRASGQYSPARSTAVAEQDVWRE
ncbi:MAG: hypothetical protein FWE88_08060 [Phycisphaerae bacterium]|nr:hypothetical protein [Phycisphaerae bacterium]